MMAQSGLLIGTILGLLLMVASVGHAVPPSTTWALLTQTPSVTATMAGSATPTPTATPTATPEPPEYAVFMATYTYFCTYKAPADVTKPLYQFSCQTAPGSSLIGYLYRFDNFIETKVLFDEIRGEAPVMDFHGYEGALWQEGSPRVNRYAAWWGNRWLFAVHTIDEPDIWTPPDPLFVIEKFYTEAATRLPLDAAPMSLYLPLLRRAAP